MTFDKDPASWFKSILTIPTHPKRPYVKSMSILTNGFRFWKVSEISDYWKIVEFAKLLLDSENWMYAYCIKFGFLKNLPEKNINIYAKTNNKQTAIEAYSYLSSLVPMTEEEITLFLNKKPIITEGQRIKNGFHRSCAMIGRLIRNETYVNI